MKNIAIFDLDGTLCDTLADLADAVNFGLEKLGYPTHNYEKYKIFVGNGVNKLCTRALPEDKKDETNTLLELFTSYYEENYLLKTSAYNGITDVLEKLSQSGFILAVATNKPQYFAEKIISKLFAEINFHKILGGCAEREKKPSPQIIRDILCDFDDEINAFMIGDSNVDIMTAKNAEIKSIGCTWGFRDENELIEANADFIAHKPSDILDFILQSK